MVAELAPAEVHLVVTAREPLGLFTASWQESVKNRDVTPMADYSRTESPDSVAVWNWRTLDLRLVLERWSPAFAPEQVHVLPLPQGKGRRRVIWDRFAGLIGVDPDAVDLSQSFPNASMGVVEAETLRRVNAHLGDFNTRVRPRHLHPHLPRRRAAGAAPGRAVLAERRAQVEECRTRGRDATAYIAEQGFDVIGDLDDLLVPDELAERRTPDR